MLALTRSSRSSRWWLVPALLVATTVHTGTGTAGTGTTRAADVQRSKANSIRSGGDEEVVVAVVVQEVETSSNRTAALHHHHPAKKHSILLTQVYPCSSDKECSLGSYCHSPQHAASRCLTCRRRKKRCHRDAMCCPGNRCRNYICVPISESVLSPHISPLDAHNKLSAREPGWRRGKAQPRHSLKGHEGDPCLRSADCSQGYCCARHFWTKICKPVLRQGEVCTKLRRKGSHGLEIFQRCDCAKGLACKVWKDASSASSASGSSTSSSSSKSRLHMCQRV